MKKKVFLLFPALLFIIWGHLSCTDLNAPAYDKLTEFWRTPEEIKAGVGLPYADYAIWSEIVIPGIHMHLE